MYELREYDQEATCKELTLDEKLFHRALEGGDKRYHVRNPKGQDFDIYYLDNNDDLEPIVLYPAYIKGPYMAKYGVYDETDKDTLYLEFLEGLRNLEFEELNEYTIALTRVVLSFTDMEVYCADPRIRWFLPEDARLHVEDELPQLPPEETLYVQKRYASGLDGRGHNCISSVYAFHNVFFLQWALDGRKLSQLKYAAVDRGENGGIGAILAYNKRYERAFDYLGLKLISREDRIGRFRTSMLDKYFSLGLVVDDATDENTLEVKDKTINYFYALYLLSRCDSFMCSGQCNGWDVVNDFNGGKFQRSYKFSVGTEQEN